MPRPKTTAVVKSGVVTQGPVANAEAMQVPPLQVYPATQPEVALQVLPQAVVEVHAYPAQVPATEPDCLQVPLPSQDPVVVAVIPLPEQAKVPAQLVAIAVKAQAPRPLPPL